MNGTRERLARQDKPRATNEEWRKPPRLSESCRIGEKHEQKTITSSGLSAR
jgi:hypothetical protein